MTDREAFLAAIIAEPERDDLRLVFADWLEENGDVEYSSFIRVQCRLAALPGVVNGVGADRRAWLASRPERVRLQRRERKLWKSLWHPFYEELRPFVPASPPIVDVETPGVLDCAAGRAVFTFRRGFVGRVSCTLGDWCGGECPKCGGSGEGVYGLEETPFTCDHCRGSGRVGGHGPALVRCQPVTKVATEKRPVKTEGRELYTWACPARRTGNLELWELPRAVFALLLPDPKCVEVRDHERFTSTRRYHAEADALAALSAACIAWAKAHVFVPASVREIPFTG